MTPTPDASRQQPGTASTIIHGDDMTLRIKTFLLAAAVSLAALAGTPARAQDYPSKPITIVVPFAAGSGTDQLARIMGQIITSEYKVPVVVENKAGASGFIAAQHVAKAPPDGYTVLMTTNTTHAANEHLYKKLPYDPVKDFTPVTLLGKGQMLLMVNPASPVKSVADLIALAKKSPGKLNFGSGSSSSRVAGELFRQMTGIDVVHVPYKSNPMAITDLIGGQVDFMFADAPTALPQVNGGKLRALAASGTKRMPAAASIPTLDESGVKGYDMSYWTAVYLPAGAPAAVTQRLNEILVKVSNTAKAKTFQSDTSMETATSTPEGLARFQAAESQKWGRVIKAAGIEPE
jgi:tripartite-type tricarboxylate transporter receptor subunit TctC